MSEQERPLGQPPESIDYSLPSLGEKTDDDGRPTNTSGTRRRAKKAFDPTQYAQGQPASAIPEASRNKRYQEQEQAPLEDLPAPSYQPQRATTSVRVNPEGVSVPEGQAEADASEGGSHSGDHRVVRSEQASEAHFREAEAARESLAVPLAVPEGHNEGANSQKKGMGKAINLAGAATSIALVLGLGFWGYRLAVRDVSGVPIVAALDGPSRIQPEDPGGELATHMGLAVNSVQADGQAEATADRLVLAPSPVEVREGDGVLKTPVVAATSKPLISEPKEDSSESKVTAPAESDAAVKESADVVNGAKLAIATTKDIKDTPVQEIVAPEPLDVSAAEQAADVDDEAAESVPTDVIASTIPGVAKSERPIVRPEGFEVQVAAQRAASKIPRQDSGASEAEAENVVEIDPESLPVGTNLTQLGAYPSEEIARQNWTEKALKFEDYMAGKARVIQKAESGGRAFYRLRAHGFENINEARQFCAALQAEGAECISVVVRK